MAWQTLLPQQDYQGHPSALPLHSQRGRPAKAHNVGPRNVREAEAWGVRRAQGLSLSLSRKSRGRSLEIRLHDSAARTQQSVAFGDVQEVTSPCVESAVLCLFHTNRS